MSVQSLVDPRDMALDSATAGTESRTVPVGEAGSDALPHPDGGDPSRHLRTTFLRRVAHDIASPAGLTTTALQELANAPVGRPELIAMAQRGVRRLLRLSEQLAIVADLEGGTLAPETTPEEAHSVATSALEHAIAIDGRREVAATLSPSCLERLPVLIDRKLVECTLREIIGNALRLAFSRVIVEVRRDDARAVIGVHDDGAGFSAESLASLGKRFTPEGMQRGLGLSLSIAKEILAAHGADLHIGHSALPPGRRDVRGAAVLVSLPLASR